MGGLPFPCSSIHCSSPQHTAEAARGEAALGPRDLVHCNSMQFGERDDYVVHTKSPAVACDNGNARLSVARNPFINGDGAESHALPRPKYLVDQMLRDGAVLPTRDRDSDPLPALQLDLLPQLMPDALLDEVTEVGFAEVRPAVPDVHYGPAPALVAAGHERMMPGWDIYWFTENRSSTKTYWCCASDCWSGRVVTPSLRPETRLTLEGREAQAKSLGALPSPWS